MSGPPGSGKTMLARRMPGILPPLTMEERRTSMRRHILSADVAALWPNATVLRPSPYASIRCEYATGGGADGGSDSASLRRGVARHLHLADSERGVPDGRASVPLGYASLRVFLPRRCVARNTPQRKFREDAFYEFQWIRAAVSPGFRTGNEHFKDHQKTPSMSCSMAL
jgi:hypothetical protein